jgi:hypothetical protein
MDILKESVNKYLFIRLNLKGVIFLVFHEVT